MNADNRRPSPHRPQPPREHAGEEFAGIGDEVARTIQGAPQAPTQVPTQGAPMSDDERRAAAVGAAIDDACARIVSQIDALIERARELKEWYVDDAARTKLAIKTHIGAGSQVVGLMGSVTKSLTELEAQRNDVLNAQVRN